MELCDNTLKEFLINRKNIDDQISIKYLKDILCGLEYLHSNNIIHRDLKPANIFIKNGIIKIGDFGLSKLVGDTKNNYLDLLQHDVIKNYTGQHMMLTYGNDDNTNDVGTYLYASPEQLDNREYDFKTDVYSFGLIYFEFYYLYTTEYEKIEMLTKIRDKQFDSFELDCSIINNIKKMTNVNPFERPIVKEIMDTI